MSPSLSDFSPDQITGIGLLRIPSFLPQYFERTAWLDLNLKLQRYRGLVIDLRDNSGGSFPAMLRTLSPFRCETPFIGSLYHMLRGSANSTLELTDTLDAENQIRQLDQATWLELRAFSTYGCFNGPTVVLVDSGTMSTAEIFTEAFSHRPRSTILGQPTAGEVVMARWFPVMSLGEDYSLSIPIAGYVTASGAEIEGIGVFPARNLFYDLGKALSGHDSWMDDALLEIRRLSAKK